MKNKIYRLCHWVLELGEINLIIDEWNHITNIEENIENVDSSKDNKNKENNRIFGLNWYLFNFIIQLKRFLIFK